MMVSRRPYEDQLGKVSCEAVTVHKSKMDQVAAQWDEEQKLEEILERRRMEGSSLKLEVMQKVPALVVHERMSQLKGLKGLKEKKKVPRWSIEEMKENSQMLLWRKTLKK